MASSSKITLRSSDLESFDVERSVAVELQTIKHMIEDDCADDAIPLPNVNSKILAKVIEYCKMHVDSARAVARINDDLRTYDADFVKVDKATVCDLIKAADYLDFKSLLDLTCQTLARVKGKTPEEIRETYTIWNSCTPEEEEVQRENEWASQ